ncbi:hypothetical protein [Chondromyces apiculatus]|uniref:Lipoprotein n=1 Tax=Chondromyces apiculatus DSM 436 TaxID=1192034 RepID=A0A017TBY5_9BACT|nr:hypothetical protein [Chondromyces apiculatus]EYF06330.1 Hypothetical protein CAP_2208 [Chondromyces apiculatus DSM 436]
MAALAHAARVAAFALFPLALFPLTAGCGPSPEKREAAAVLHAIDVLRDAPAEPASGRVAHLQQLEQVSASDPRSARARDDCVKAYRLLLEGNALEAKVRGALADPSGLTPEILRDLGAAEDKIEESTAAMPACDTALADLHRWLR